MDHEGLRVSHIQTVNTGCEASTRGFHFIKKNKSLKKTMKVEEEKEKEEEMK